MKEPDAESDAKSVSDTAQLEHLVGILRADPSLAVFLSEDFAPTKHVGTTVRQHRIQSALEEAQRASSLLSSNVRQEVIRRKEALLSEVDAVDALEKEVQSVSTGVTNLVTASEGLSSALEQPFEPMAKAVRLMTNMTAASDLLRAVARFRHCTAKLADAGLFPAIGPTAATIAGNLPAAAEAVKELESLTASSGPAGLDKVDGIAKDVIAVRKASPELRKRAGAILKAGLASKTQIDVEAAVVAFNSLGVLTERMNTEFARMLRETQNAVHRSLEAPHGSSKGSDTNEIWTKIEKMLDTVGESCVKVVLLQQVLSRKYCDTTHMSLLHDTIASNFVDGVSRTIAEQVSILARTRFQRPAAAFVFLTLAEGYPRLRGLLKDMAKRVSAIARVSPTPITKLGATAKLPLIPGHEFIEKAFLSAVMEVETHYLTASLERLTETVTSFFDSNVHPGETKALSLTKALAAELSAARSDKQLFRTAVNNVATAIRLYTSNAQDLAAASVPDSEPNGKALGEVEEWRLTTIYNGMVTLASSASRVLGAREDGSGPIPEPIAKELSTLRKFTDLLLDGPFSTCKSNICSVMRRMHTEDLEGDVGDDGCSVYVLDIAAQLSMFADGIIPGLCRSRTLGANTLSLARWVLDTFAEHVALVFPQSQGAKMRLSTDMARIELAVESLCTARLLGKSYRALRALRRAILLPTEALQTAETGILEEMKTLKPSTLSHLILGRTSDEKLKQPHRRREMSPAEYVAWIESHSEDEAWAEVETSLKLFKENVGETTASAEYQTVDIVCRRLRENVQT